MDIDLLYKDLRQNGSDSIEIVTEDLRQIRTGKATPSLVENLEVSAYEGQSIMKLREMASISTDGPTTIVIDPFDPSAVQDIEKAIYTSPMKLSPNVDGKIIRITTPPLTEEQRQQFAKLANQKVEEGKIAIRQARDHTRKKLKSLLDNKTVTEDDKYRAEKEIDNITKELSDQLEELKKRKQEEIMQI